MGLSGAVVALAFGPMIDRFGAKRMLFATVALVAVHAFLLAQTQYLWKDTLYVKAMLSAWIMLGPVTMVCMIALAMTICASVNSATQFAIYMSIANLGSSIGSKVYGMVSEQASFTDAYLLLGALAVALLAALSCHRHRHAHDRDGADGPDGGRNDARTRKTAPRYTVGLGASGAGMYWSGAMRCPKCRSDMELLTIDGVEIDRCTTCRGLWFDPGETEKLRSRKIAAAIDIGEPVAGSVGNASDRYRCPRCGGKMLRTTDALQKHIWYEECEACHGSYFDAGEFTDLATLSVSDLFKRFATPKRG